MKTGELAAKAGVNIQTIRFYERKRLLREPPRTASGYRSYTETDLERIQFIRDCQDLGFTLTDIKQLIELHTFLAGGFSGNRRGERMMKVVQDRLESINQKLASLTRMRDGLMAALNESESRHLPVCPAQMQRGKK